MRWFGCGWISVMAALLILNIGCGVDPDNENDGEVVSENGYAVDEYKDGERAIVPQTALRLDLPLPEFPYSFTNEPFVNPRLIDDLLSWISDSGDQVVAINLLEAQNCNRYSSTAERWDNERAKTLWGSNPVVGYNERGEGNSGWLSYVSLGQTDSGVHVLVISQNTGGSMTLRRLLFLTVESDMGLSHDWDDPVIRQTRPRLLLKSLGNIVLGDRWAGTLRVEGNQLLVGADDGWFRGRPHGGELSEDPKDRVIRIDF